MRELGAKGAFELSGRAAKLDQAPAWLLGDYGQSVIGCELADQCKISRVLRTAQGSQLLARVTGLFRARL
jgi:hypothetical protein